MVGVALGNNTAGGAQGDGSLAQILDSGIGGHAVKGGHGILGHEVLAIELLEQHIYGTLGTTLLLEEVLADAVGHIAFLAGGAYLLALHELESQLCHAGSSLAHTGGAVGGLIYEDLVLQVCAGVLDVHTGKNRDAQLFLYREGYVGAGIAVTACVEGGTRDEHIGLLGLDPLEDLSLGVLFMLRIVGVAADDCLYDFSLALPCLIESHAGAYKALTKLGGYVSHFLTADVGEELVDVMNYTITHGFGLLPYYLALR